MNYKKFLLALLSCLIVQHAVASDLLDEDFTQQEFDDEVTMHNARKLMSTPDARDQVLLDGDIVPPMHTLASGSNDDTIDSYPLAAALEGSSDTSHEPTSNGAGSLPAAEFMPEETAVDDEQMHNESSSNSDQAAPASQAAIVQHNAGSGSGRSMSLAPTEDEVEASEPKAALSELEEQYLGEQTKIALLALKAKQCYLEFGVKDRNAYIDLLSRKFNEPIKNCLDCFAYTPPSYYALTKHKKLSCTEKLLSPFEKTYLNQEMQAAVLSALYIKGKGYTYNGKTGLSKDKLIEEIFIKSTKKITCPRCKKSLSCWRSARLHYDKVSCKPFTRFC